jgi:hypothetical protein
MFHHTIRSIATPIALASVLGFAAASSALAVPPPPNDGFGHAENLVGCSAFTEGDNVSATRQRGEPRHFSAASAPTNSVWLRWRSPVTGTVVMDTIGSDFDTILAVYRGRFVNRLTEVASDDDSGGLLTSQVTFQANRNVTYKIAIDGFGAAQGNYLLSINC